MIPTNHRLVYFLGLILIVISFLTFLIGYTPDNFDTAFLEPSTCLCYFFTLVYGIVILFDYFYQSRPRSKMYLGNTANLVVLFTISAFSLNQSITLFAPFPTWLTIYTGLGVFVFLAYPFFKHMSTWGQSIIYFISGLVMVLSVYMAIFLLPAYPISIFLIWVIGLSLHTFVPLFWFFMTMYLLIKNPCSKSKWFFGLGVLLPVLFMTIYLWKWSALNKQVNEIVQHNTSNVLPESIILAQQLPDDPLTEEIIISPFKAQDGLSMSFGTMNGNNRTFHDPIAIIGRGLFKYTTLDESTVQTVLNLRRDFRHHSSRRLWTGTDLLTTKVKNTIELFPEYRIAYQEKVITIKNDPKWAQKRSWFRTSTQEAVYTFHVPEGTIVTSLSLWINGKEEKSRLTTKQKADSAYTTIVGVESRDPALVHWQEGNRVTVTVFPCTEQEDRTFKIGFTTPLTSLGRQCVLENCWFEGPEISNCTEETEIIINGQWKNLLSDKDEYEINKRGNYFYSGEYRPYWQLSFGATPISEEVFVFNGNKYSVQYANGIKQKFDPEEIYLDLMKDWTSEEVDEVMDILKEEKVYVWLPEKTLLTNKNKMEVWEKLKTYQFSLPYLYTIDKPKSALIITKSGYKTPTLSDVKGFPFANMTNDFINNSNEKVKVLNIGNELSPFWKSLREFRCIDYCKGDKYKLSQIINEGVFEVLPESNNSIVIHDSQLLITKVPENDSSVKCKAPDHLLRLYCYNDVMRNLGREYFNSTSCEEEALPIAEEGYVLTPFTSMIVLESEQDYKRMGIKENTKTVGNASVLSGGAVPEPHEWALIILVALVIVYVKWNNARRKWA